MCVALLLLLVTTSPAIPPAIDDLSLQRVRERGELLWGADAHGGAPYVFQDPNNPRELIGFEVDLANAVAQRLGIRARMVQGPWDKLPDLLTRGDFDVALNGIEDTPDKRAGFLLSRPYYVAEQRLTVRRGDKLAPPHERALARRPVGCLPGTLAETLLRRREADVRTYDTQDDIFRDLALGRTDAAVTDAPIAHYYGDVDDRLQTYEISLGELSYVALLRPDATSLHRAVNDTLEELAREGTLRAIYERWGIWNDATASLLHDSGPARGVPSGFVAWRAATAGGHAFVDRVRHRYWSMMPLFARGAALTLAVSVLAMVLAIALGIVLATARAFGPWPVRIASTMYVEVFRGTPLLVQLTVIYFGLPELGLTLSPFAAGVLALGLNYAAAESENYRAGLLAVPRTQLDAARALGLSTGQALRLVLLPQAVRVALPPMTNDFIALLKDSSLISVVTLTELTKVYGILGNSTRDHLGLGAVVALWYLLIGFPFVLLARRLEARLGRHRPNPGPGGR